MVLASCVKRGEGHGAAANANGGTAMTTNPDSLRALAKARQRHVGVALATWHFSDSRYSATARAEFDSLTAENEMKWQTVEPQPGSFAFEAGDKLVAFAEQQGMRVRGHTLVWHNQLAPWVNTLSGERLRSAMVAHIQGTVGHWKGRIAQWDVVNEALADDGELRKESVFSQLGPGYIADAFHAAHEADPNAELVYNDYETEGDEGKKSDGMYRLVKQLKERGAPIHGVGFQMHVDPRRWPSVASIQRNFERYAALGLFIELTEMDIPVGELTGSAQEKLEQQKKIAHDIVAACLAVPACKAITFWGLADPQSWLATPRWGQLRGRGPHLPLLFDADYRRKPVFDGVAAALRGQ